MNLARFAARARRVKAVKASLSELADEVTRSDSEVRLLHVVKAGSGPVAYGRASARRLGVKLAGRPARRPPAAVRARRVKPRLARRVKLDETERSLSTARASEVSLHSLIALGRFNPSLSSTVFFTRSNYSNLSSAQ